MAQDSIYRVGDKYKLVLTTVTETSSDKSSGRSNSRNTLTEKIISYNRSGVELEFDLPADVAPDDRARNWQFPVRVLKQHQRPFELLNSEELKNRVQPWLEQWDIPEEACGQWVFTWTGFKIECDPDSVLQILETFDLWHLELRDGAQYLDPMALAPARFSSSIDEAGSTIFAAKMDIDPAIVMRERAEQAVIVAEIMGDSEVTFEDELRKQSLEDVITGSITVTFEVDGTGQITTRKRVIDILTVLVDDSTEHQLITERLTRRLLESGN